jgi:Sulfotransferase family
MSLHILGKVDLTFIHIWKTGGTSFRHWLEDRELNNDISLKIYKNHRSIAQLKLIYEIKNVCTIVRNPWDRMISIYYFLYKKMQKNQVFDDNGLYPNEIEIKFITDNFIIDDNIIDFKTFVTNIEKITEKNPILPGYWFNFLTEQCEWLSNTNPDILIKLENIEQDFKKIQEIFDIYIPFYHRNKSRPAQVVNYIDYYDAKTRDIIGKHFKNDIEQFGYKF